LKPQVTNDTLPCVDCYTFPFAPNPNWSKFMAPGAEIHKYIKDTAAKFGLEEPIQFNSSVQAAEWDESTGKWNIKVAQNGKVIEDSADIVINATGFLR
jgi:cation diffusion facilitator CzcD-associated flavoprotein CzcO